MMIPFRGWWRAGEDGAIAVYRQNNAIFLIVNGLFLLATAPVMIGFGYPALLAIPLSTVARSIVERRRAIIFTPTELVYRPVFAAPIRAAFSDIVEVKEKGFTLTWMLRYLPVAGLILTLKNGDVQMIPMDFVERSEIVRRLDSGRAK
jgi:hypothetical protein